MTPWKILALLGSAVVCSLARRSRKRQRPPSSAGSLLTPLMPERNDTALTKAFVQGGLHEQGYDEGRNVVIEYRYADRHFERLPELAEELVRLRPDMIVAEVTAASLAAKKATNTIPIVMNSVGDPVGAGLVANLAHPGGNVTGTSSIRLKS